MSVKEVAITGVGTINDEKLDADIRAAVADYAGFSRRPKIDGIVLIFDPTVSDADIATAQGIVTAHDPNVKTPNQQLKQTILATAQSAVGVALNDLTLAQVKALIAVSLYKEGAIAEDLTIKPLGQWGE